jgi:serine/threonine-protein kinase RsbT
MTHNDAEREYTITIGTSHDIVLARSKGRTLAHRAGFGLADQTRLATAISEVARNVLKYAGCGRCTLTDESNEHERKIAVLVEDEGPGIPDIDLAMSDGYSTGNSLGAGLPGAKRITTQFVIESRPGYTRVYFEISRARLY